MGADPDSITISGHSAGCYMSERMMIIHSDNIKGAGLFQCWSYGTDFVDQIQKSPASDLAAHTIEDIDEAEAEGEISATSNLANRSVYIYSGIQDTITPPAG